MLDLKRFPNYATDFPAFTQDLDIPAASGNTRWGSVMADFQRERHQALAPPLLAVARGQTPGVRRFLFEGVKGSNKTGDAAAAVLWRMIFDPHLWFGQWGANDKDQAGELRRTMQALLAANPVAQEFVDMQTWVLKSHKTGSEMAIIAADIAGSHGQKPDMLIIDELSHVQKSDYLLNLLDNSSKRPSCLTMALTNAGLVNSEAWRLREIWRTSPNWFFHKVTICPPWLAAEMEEARMRNPPARFARLWEGVWSTSGDFMDPEALTEAFKVECMQHDKALPDFTYAAGCDLGLSRDAASLVVVGKHNRTGRYALARVWFWLPPKAGKIDLEGIEQAFVDANVRYRLRAAYLDPWQGEGLQQRLAKHHVPVEVLPFTEASHDEMARHVLSMLTDRSVDLYEHERLRAELSRMQVVEKASGKLKIEHPRDQQTHSHGDVAVAWTLASLAAKDIKARGRFEVIVGGGPRKPQWGEPDYEFEEEQGIPVRSLNDVRRLAGGR